MEKKDIIFSIAVIIAATMPFWLPILLIVVAFILDMIEAYRARVSNYYPNHIRLHRKECPCERCLKTLHYDINRIEKELGMEISKWDI